MNIYIPFSNFEQDETGKKLLYFANNLWNKKLNPAINIQDVIKPVRQGMD